VSSTWDERLLKGAADRPFAVPPLWSGKIEDQRKGNVMRVLIRNAQTGFYCGAGGQWVSEAAVAMDFRNLETAGRKAIQFQREKIRVVLWYETPRCELALAPEFCV
jgi:hypothetical protein